MLLFLPVKSLVEAGRFINVAGPHDTTGFHKPLTNNGFRLISAAAYPSIIGLHKCPNRQQYTFLNYALVGIIEPQNCSRSKCLYIYHRKVQFILVIDEPSRLKLCIALRLLVRKEAPMPGNLRPYTLPKPEFSLLLCSEEKTALET